MHELHAVLDAWRAAGHGSDVLLATVVRVTGSAYRRPGARMLVTPERVRTGTISGGCLEADVAKKGWWATSAGQPVLRVYDTMSEDAAWEYGMGCNGVIEILLERSGMAGCLEHLTFLQEHRVARTRAAVATVIAATDTCGARIGDRLLLDEAGVQGGALGGADIEGVVWQRLQSALAAGQSEILHLDGVTLFLEVTEPPVPLVIFGAGDDARPLSDFAQSLGWEVTVADGRPGLTGPDRFPGARVVTLRSTDLLAGLDIDDKTMVVMMTHNYPLDASLLPLVLAAEPAYLGILGPRARTEQLFVSGGHARPATVHAPIGLDLGGDTPASIALGIAAEVQAVLKQREGRKLRERRLAIHAQLPEIGRARSGESRVIANFDGCTLDV